MLVMKFGGTSVADAKRMNEVVDLVLESRGDDTETVVVVSAMAGTTDILLNAARAAAVGTVEAWQDELKALMERHQATAAALTTNEAERAAIFGHINNTFTELSAVLRSIDVLGELTPRALDRVAGAGERLSAPLVSLAFRGRGFASEAVDASVGVVITDGHFGEATPDSVATWYGARTKLRPMLKEGIIPVVTGYVGATPDGVVTTLGRGGSDYSAAIVGAALEADEVWIWSDVDGILTADPKIVPEARVLSNLSYLAAAELASCGADVLHPKTIRPLVRTGVPLRLKNTFNAAHPGTLISSRYSEHPPAIISMNDLCLVTIKAEADTWSPDVTAASLERMARAGVNVLLYLQSAWQHGVSVLVRCGDREPAMMSAATDKLMVNVRPDVATVSVVGAHVIIPTLAALGETGAQVLAISQATVDAGIIVVVPADEMPPLVRHLHERVSLNHRN
ncbi:MAG: aspartate kinase [Anaerolineae bacterium]|nr:aspartate kinase [Anaerolineae bacterium]